MKCKHEVVLMLWVALLGVSGTALAADSVGLEVRTADKLDDTQLKSVQQFITDQTTALGDSSNPVQQAHARDQLVSTASSPGTKPASAEYVNAYSTALNEALKPLTQSPDVRVRVLAGVVAAKTAEKVKNLKLQEAAIALLNDKSDAVAYWGMRTARFILPAVLQNPMAQSPLMDAVVPAVKSHPSAPMAHDAYDAFASVQASAGAAAIVRSVDLTQKLMHARVEMYTTLLPEDPGADAIGTSYLSTVGPTGIWPLLNAQQKVDTVQAISDLLSVMGQRGAVEDHRTFADRINPEMVRVAKAAYVIAPDKSPLQDALTPLTKIPAGANGPDVMAEVAKIYPAIQAIPAFSTVKAPPTIQGGAAPADTTVSGTAGK